MLDVLLDNAAKVILMKRKEDFRTLFIIFLAWFALFINWNYIYAIENKRKFKVY